MVYWPVFQLFTFPGGPMAAILWAIRTLSAIFLGLTVMVAFLGWLALSTLATDLGFEESGAARLAVYMETIDHAQATQFRHRILQNRGEAIQDIDRAAASLLVLVIAGLAAMGLIHLPDVRASLRWPGYTLLLTGIVALALALLAQSALPELVDRSAGPPGSGPAPASGQDLLVQNVAPGLWAAFGGATLLSASIILGRWQRGRHPKLPQAKDGFPRNQKSP